MSPWERASPYVFLFALAATLYGVMVGAGKDSRRYVCRLMGGGILSVGVAPIDVTTTPQGVVIHTPNRIYMAESCRQEDP